MHLRDYVRLQVCLRDISVRMEAQNLRGIDDGQTLNVAHVLLHGLAKRDIVAGVEAK